MGVKVQVIPSPLPPPLCGWTHVCLWNRSVGGHVTQAPPHPVLSCSDSDSEVDPSGTQGGRVLEAASPSVVPLAGPMAAPPPVATETPKPFIPASDSFINSLVSDRDKASTPQASITEEAEEPSPAPVLPTPAPAGQDVPWMNVDLEGAEAACGGQEDSASPADGGAVPGYTLGTLETSRVCGESDGPVWTWISGGGCEVDADSRISWLSPTGRCRTTSGGSSPNPLLLSLCVSVCLGCGRLRVFR